MPEPVPGTLAEALAQLQGRLPRVAKTSPGQVGNQKYLYADLADVSAALLPVMASLGLSFFAGPTLEGDRFVLGYKLLHKSGEELAGAYPLPTSGTPQQVGSAITYARRYTLCAVTGLAPGGDDDDGNAAEQGHQPAARPGPHPAPRNVPDAQLAATGQMTRAQKAGHERLAADTVRDPKRAERSHPRGPDPDDPWAQDAPVDHQRAVALRENLNGRDLTDREDKPGTATDEQQTDIAMRLAKKGITRREDKLVFCATVTDRDITTSRELSYSEAVAVLKAADKLPAVLVEA
jgi:hypothetical protein